MSCLSQNIFIIKLIVVIVQWGKSVIADFLKIIHSVFSLVEFTVLFYSEEGHTKNEPKMFKEIKCLKKCKKIYHHNSHLIWSKSRSKLPQAKTEAKKYAWLGVNWIIKWVGVVFIMHIKSFAVEAGTMTLTFLIKFHIDVMCDVLFSVH